MATGKSTVGRQIALRAGRPFVDLDVLVEARAGRSVSDIFRDQGEAAFRLLEREVLSEVLSDSARTRPVVALGGGTLLDRATRLDAIDRAVLITLDASPDEVARRARGDRERPLLQCSDPAQRAAELLAVRGASYAESHARIRTDELSVEQVADAALEIWKSDPLAVAAGERSYAVEIGVGLLETRLPSAIGAASRVILVSDRTVYALHGARAQAAIEKHPSVYVELLPGEEHKHIRSVEAIWTRALEAGADRRSLLVALGGGVVSDIAGFAAATYMRGVAWIGVPTTLLAMVDASVGGKTGVDLGPAKNAVGAFWQPKRVLCDVGLLATESPRGFRSALAEVVKSALIGDPGLLTLLETDADALFGGDAADVARLTLLEELVRRSIRVKANIVSRDERESGQRALLNLGHTVGHALEAVAGYTRLTHGEAISLGLVAALRIGVELGVTPKAVVRRIEGLLARLGLPTDLSAEPIEDAVRLIGHDKKRAGQRLRFIVARDEGHVEGLDVGLEELAQLTRSLK
jgi:shikimate kinase/3-dehydroquinate synthase